MDDGGIWWTAISKHTPRELRRKFRKQDVGGVLLEHVRGFKSTDQTYWDERVIMIKLCPCEDRTLQAGIDLCLSEIGIGLLEPVTEERKQVT